MLHVDDSGAVVPAKNSIRILLIRAVRLSVLRVATSDASG
jgi:hypothetical protein